MEKLLIVGLGEVGTALYKIAVSAGGYSVYGYDIDPSRTVNKLEEIPSPIDYLHIAIPYKSMESFVSVVAGYASRFKPRIIFVHSTVAPGTTRKLHETIGVPIAYTPVRGKHPCLDKHLLFWPKWVTTLPDNALDEAAEHLRRLGMKVKACKCAPESLELAKLWETVYRATMIAAWQEIHRIALETGADISIIAEFVAEVHNVLRDRPVMYPDVIGGHCLIPNTIILHSTRPSKLFEFILESNEKRKTEVKDKHVKEDIEKVKKIALQLANRNYLECRT